MGLCVEIIATAIVGRSASSVDERVAKGCGKSNLYGNREWDGTGSMRPGWSGFPEVCLICPAQLLASGASEKQIPFDAAELVHCAFPPIPQNSRNGWGTQSLA